MKQLTGRDLLDGLARGDGPRPLLLDVREPWEVRVAPLQVPGLATRHVPMDDVPLHLPEFDPAQRIVCVCHHGVRSAQVADFLERNGFADAWNLAGGIDAWSIEIDPGVPRY